MWAHRSDQILSAGYEQIMTSLKEEKFYNEKNNGTKKS